jgi:hypothetical protein
MDLDNPEVHTMRPLDIVAILLALAVAVAVPQVVQMVAEAYYTTYVNV